MKTTKFFGILAIVLATMSTTALVQAQTASAPYGEVSFIKVNPGMGESFIAANKIMKKLNNSQKKAKVISSWQLYKRVYPLHGSLDFNYATFTVFPGGKEMQAVKDLSIWDSAVKELTAKEHLASIGTLPTIRTTVEKDLYVYKMGAGAGGSSKAGEYVLLSRIKVNTGSMDAYEKTLEMLKPVMEEAIKAGKLKSWNVWKRMIATNIDGVSHFTIGFIFNNMEDALAYSSGKVDTIAEFKKAHPKEDYTAFRAKQVSLREVVSQEMWELLDITD